MKIDREAHFILSKVNEGSLATLESNKPYVSSIGFLYEEVSAQSDEVGTFYLLLSDLARHTKNIKNCADASLLVVDRASNVSIHEMSRVSIQGHIDEVHDRELFQQLRKKYLCVFPKAEIFFGLPDFRFYALNPLEVQWIGGFGKARSFS